EQPHPLDHLAPGAAQVHGVAAGSWRGRDLHDRRCEAVPPQPERERRPADTGARNQYRPVEHLSPLVAYDVPTYASTVRGLVTRVGVLVHVGEERSMNQPPYQRIADEIRARIAGGELRPGDPVPSARGITREWGVALATATKVLATLSADGLTRSVPGRGT